ncbi:MAG: SDR family NAD(P)-dependent oxidoreductase [Congregibacter sp.]
MSMPTEQTHPSELLSLAGKVAIVTGAGKGIGRACAETLSAAGAHVIAVARTQEDLDSLGAEIDGSIEAWCLDATGEALLQRIEALEQLDVLVNNAGTNRPQSFLEADVDALDSLLGLNLRAAFRVAQAAARVMARSSVGGTNSSGSIIHMGSQMGHVGAINRSVYCMTKAGIEGLTKATAVELAPLGIRVNSVAPTFIETPMTRPMLDDPDFARNVLAKIPLGKLGKVHDVANAVLFLASDASGMITGDSIKVDGGWTAV